MGQVGIGPEQCGVKEDMMDLNQGNLPIQITEQSQNGDQVSFKIVQNFYDGVIKKVALNYDRGIVDIACEVNSDVGADWSETYTAACINGKATVKLYLHFCDGDPVTNNPAEIEQSKCDYCGVPDSNVDYLAISVELDCYEICETEVAHSGSGLSPSI